MILPYEDELKRHPAISVETNSHNQPTENKISSQIISETLLMAHNSSALRSIPAIWDSANGNVCNL